MGGRVSSTEGKGEGSPDGGGPPEPETTRCTRSHLLLLTRAHNKFAIAFYQEFAKDGKRPGNFIICPLGVSLGLGMVLIGAKGNCRDEMHKALHLSELQDIQTLPAYAAIHWDILRSSFPKGCQFEIAVAPFIPLDVHTSAEYDDRIMHYELTQPRGVDFVHRHDRARKEIAEWAEQKTHGKIKNVIPLGLIDRDTNVFLLVAVHIKVQWKSPFSPSLTQKMPFYLPMKETPNVNMMYQQGKFRWAHHSKMDCDVLELPFTKSHNKMLVFLPRKPEGVGKVDSKLSRAFVEAVCEALTPHTVDVYLPKFRYELGHTTGDKLQALGMKDLMTSGKAQLPGFEGRLGIHLSRCFHHVYFEFEEGSSGAGGSVGGGAGGDKDKGDKASVAGSSGGGGTSELEVDPKKIKTFRCDHPFLVMIKDDRTGAILLIGRIVRPLIA